MLGFGESRGDGGGGFHGGDLFLAVGLLGGAELFFHLHLELVGGAAELADPLAQLAREHRQLLRPEQQERENEEENAVGKAGHTGLDDTAWGRLEADWTNGQGSQGHRILKLL